MALALVIKTEILHGKRNKTKINLNDQCNNSDDHLIQIIKKC